MFVGTNIVRIPNYKKKYRFFFEITIKKVIRFFGIHDLVFDGIS